MTAVQLLISTLSAHARAISLSIGIRWMSGALGSLQSNQIAHVMLLQEDAEGRVDGLHLMDYLRCSVEFGLAISFQHTFSGCRQ